MKLDEIKDMPIWVCWKYGSVRANGKRSKIPINPKTGKNAQTNNPDTWSTYEQAYRSVYENLYSGVGLMLVNGLMGIDIDAVFNPETNEIEESTQKIIDLFDSYTEITPSGKGFHILCTGIKPAGIGSKIVTDSIESLEFYQSKQDESGAVLNGRFFTFTGNSYHTEPKDIENRTDCINEFCKEFFTKESPAIKKKQQTNHTQPTVYISKQQQTSKTFTDDSLIKYCGNNLYSGDMFNQLFFSGYPAGANMSIEDLAFIGYMVKAGCLNPDQLDRVYRKSAIYRDKWDEIHDGKRTYGQMTIDKALEGMGMIKENNMMDNNYNGRFTPASRKNYFSSQIESTRISTGFNNLDKALNGGLTDQLYILGAETGAGKSSFCMQMMENIASADIPVLVYALEMSEKELIARGVSRQSYLLSKCSWNIRPYSAGNILGWIEENGIYTKLAYDNYEKAHKQYNELIKDNLFIIQNEADPITVDTIYKDAEEFKREFGIAPIILVDYLQMLAPCKDDASQHDRKTKLDYAIRKLKTLSATLETPIIAISSLNRGSYGKDSKGIALDSFKESGDIEYTANVLLALKETYRNDEYREIELEILKGRNNAIGAGSRFTYYPKYNHFEESNEPKRKAH